MIRSTMSEVPLTINAILRHGRRVHATSECVTFTGDGVRRATYGEVADNADRLAAALTRLGIQPGDPVGTFMWNNQEHLEAYFAVPCMGAVLHTLNIRLSHEQLVYVTNHAGDRVVIVDESLLPVIGAVAAELATVEAWIVVGDGDASALEATGRPVYRYDQLLAQSRPASSTPSPTRPRPRRCVTRAARQATRRVWCTRTARRTCTRSPGARRPSSAPTPPTASSRSCRSSTRTDGGCRTSRSCPARRY